MTADDLSPHVIETLAAAAHMSNRSYCVAQGDFTQPLWEYTPEWQRESARKGVLGALNGDGPKESHESWLAEKQRTGWKYGPVKDVEAKEHPCFVPYDALPIAQRWKDALYLDTVRQVFATLGVVIT